MTQKSYVSFRTLFIIFLRPKWTFTGLICNVSVSLWKNLPTQRLFWITVPMFPICCVLHTKMDFGTILSCTLSYEYITKAIVSEHPQAGSHPFYGEWISGYASGSVSKQQSAACRMLWGDCRRVFRKTISLLQRDFCRLFALRSGFFGNGWEGRILIAKSCASKGKTWCSRWLWWVLFETKTAHRVLINQSMGNASKICGGGKKRQPNR